MVSICQETLWVGTYSCEEVTFSRYIKRFKISCQHHSVKATLVIVIQNIQNQHLDTKVGTPFTKPFCYSYIGNIQNIQNQHLHTKVSET